MIENLIKLILGASVTFGVGANASQFYGKLTETQQKEYVTAKTEAVQELSQADKDFITSLEGQRMRDLTLEQRTQLETVLDKIQDNTLTNITDPALKTAAENWYKEREAFREEREAARANGTGGMYGKGNGNGNGNGKGNGNGNGYGRQNSSTNVN